MQNGYTHIAMVEMDGTQKAEIMSDTTQAHVARHGMVSQAYYQNNTWRTYDDDNDGLWTSMYGAGELMRYASLRNDPNASDTQIEQARQIATRSAEAVLMLHYISMRTGTTQAYVRRQVNGEYPWDTEDRWLSADALEKGGNGAMVVPSKSPADRFNSAYLRYTVTGAEKTLLNEGYICPGRSRRLVKPCDNANAGTKYEKQTRLLEALLREHIPSG
jgi:predicted DNA-binding protein